MYSGEPVTQLQHALQSALLAEKNGADEELVVAAFLHDLGHLVNDRGDTPTLRGIDDRHEYVALPFLRGLFGAAVLQPIRLHVEAKRYLCARGDGTVSAPPTGRALSADSSCSLERRAASSRSPRRTFIAQPHAEAALRLWDDRESADASTPPIAHYLAISARVAEPLG
jgi:predicted HD phosphohydrolase